MNEDDSTSESKIDGLSILKKDLNNFEVDSNLEEVTWIIFSLKSEDWLPKTMEELED